MEKLKSKIIPLLGKRIKTQMIEEFLEELPKYLDDYVEVVVEEPIEIPKQELKKNVWETLLNMANCNSLERYFLSIDDLETYLEKHRERFKSPDVTFLPSNIKLYSSEARLNGRYVRKHTVCYVYVMGPHPLRTAKHEFGHRVGLSFGHYLRHPNTECVMKLSTMTGDFCGSCQEFIERSLNLQAS